MEITMKKKQHKLVCIVFGTLLLSTIGIKSASAIPIPNLKNTSIGRVYEQLTLELSSVENFFKDFFTNDLKNLGISLGKDLSIAIDQTIGALEIPDVIQARKNTEKIASQSEKPVYRGDEASNEIERQISRSIVNTNLSKAGQQQNRRKTQLTQNTIELADLDAIHAQNRVSTQFVIKDIANQNARIEETLGAIRNDGIGMRLTEDMQLVNLTNISSGIDAQNKQNRQEIVGEAYDILYETSRARLF